MQVWALPPLLRQQQNGEAALLARLAEAEDAAEALRAGQRQ